MSPKPPSSAARSVYVVEDDGAMRDAIATLLRSAGLQVHAYASAGAFLDRFAPQGPCCIVLDVRMPEMSGTQVQEQLLARGLWIPIVFVTGHGDIPMAVETMRKGAIDFLEKPFDPGRFLEVVLGALEQDAVERESANSRRAAQVRLEALTARERGVLAMILDGRPNRVIAGALGISAKTVEFHRANIMRKLEVDSAAELVRLCVEAKFPAAER